MRRIAAVSLFIAFLVTALLLGGLKLASEVFAQTSTGQDSEVSRHDDGWLVSDFSSIVFEEGLWEQAGLEGGCTLYGSLSEENKPASVMVFNGPNEVTRSYSGTGATVKVCDLTVFLPPLSVGVTIRSNEDE